MTSLVFGEIFLTICFSVQLPGTLGHETLNIARHARTRLFSSVATGRLGKQINKSEVGYLLCALV